MQYHKTKNGKYWVTSVHIIDEDVDNQRILMCDTKTGLRNMVKKTITKNLKNENTVLWNKDTEYEVKMFTDEDNISDPKYIQNFVTTVTKKGTISHHVKRRKNPKYWNVLECGVCYKKVEKLQEVVLLNGSTKRSVCGKCKSTVNLLREKMEVAN